MFNTHWYRALLVLTFLSLSACGKPATEWQTLTTLGEVTARHEASLVAHKGQLYLMGGRRINPVERFDPATQTWTQLSKTPIELHHFQAVSYGDAIYMIGAMTGGFPHEKPLSHVLKYYPAEDRFEYGHEIPKARRRGGAGVAIYNDKMYIVGGITHGHMYGSRAWLDEYDPKTGEWRVLPDAPHKRDHVQAAIVGDQLYAFAGRRSSFATNQPFELTTTYGDQFDIGQQRWLAPTQNLAIPTERAGNMVIAWENYVIVGGGESAAQQAAHSEVEAFNTTTGQWETLPNLQRGRHGSGFAVIDGYLYTASGCGNAGGSPELTSIERIQLAGIKPQRDQQQAKTTDIHMQWHTVTLPFNGPQTSEASDPNPFMDYRLQVRFSHAETSYDIPGFYSADGKALQSGSDKGDIWQVRFTPDRTGLWRYEAELRYGKDIAISDEPDAGRVVALSQSSGEFLVVESDKSGADFRAHGRLIADKGYFRFQHSDNYWLKGGTNSPENFLGYTEFDGTYLAATSAREGEAVRDNHMHSYEPHIQDWQLGDPLWHANAAGSEGKGKGIIGAINYLAEQGMNAAYFLTFNLTGDGNDVWPYTSHEEFERFDVSKLEQWNLVFDHMQAKGIMLHMVTQETENEKLLDGGNTERLRKLYYRELIARFGHHLALVWNLGEENGPADFSPDGQTDQQRIDMANYLKAHDPYKHPLLIHTHSSAEDKDHILKPLLGLASLDGSSFQVNHRERVNQEIALWRQYAEEAGQPWLITMDEIGQWHTGALPDSVDPKHDTLREHALWGAILGGAAGVEWYFGAKHPANDLSSEDWRMRHNLWGITRHALTFFEDRPFWRYTPCNSLLSSKGYCAGEAGNEYVIYSAKGQQATLAAGQLSGSYDAYWFDPIKGGELQRGNLGQIDIAADAKIDTPLGQPPYAAEQDWVVLLKAAINNGQANAF